MRAVVLRYPRDLPHKRHRLRLSALVGRQGPKPSRSLSIIQQHALGPSGFGLASSLPCSTTMPVRGRYEAPPSAAPGGCGRPFCCSTSSARSGSASDAHTCTRAHAHTHFVRWPGTLALPLCSASRLSRTAPPRWTRRTPPTLPAKPACFARCPPCCPPGQALCPCLRTGARFNPTRRIARRVPRTSHLAQLFDPAFDSGEAVHVGDVEDKQRGCGAACAEGRHPRRAALASGRGAPSASR
jgi:hypothetical protein